MKCEIYCVYQTFQYYSLELDDSTAKGLLIMIGSKRFIFSLYLLASVLEPLDILSRIFQATSFNFSHVQSTLFICKKNIKEIADSNQVVEYLKSDWQKLCKILPVSQKEFTEPDYETVRSNTKKYCSELIKHIDERFPEPEVLFAFRIFDKREIPGDVKQRKIYGNFHLRLLLQRFQVVPVDKFEKVENDYAALNW